jgi:nitrogen fixation protein NifU and related proteins
MRSTASSRGSTGCAKSSSDGLRRALPPDHPRSLQEPSQSRVIEGADAQAEGQNPLCGDEVAISLNFDGDGETIADIRFRGRGCAISQAATSMLMEMVKGRTGSEVAAMSKADLLEEVGIPAHPGPAQVRALLGLGVLKVALHRGWAAPDELELKQVTRLARPPPSPDARSPLVCAPGGPALLTEIRGQRRATRPAGARGPMSSTSRGGRRTRLARRRARAPRPRCRREARRALLA